MIDAELRLESLFGPPKWTHHDAFYIYQKKINLDI